jgi:hypothetical protein
LSEKILGESPLFVFMAKGIGPTTPLAFVPDLTELVVEFVGKSQPIKVSCASKRDKPWKKKKAARH